jgi:glycosyltransferase involved in cell wall biosynthesis
VGDVNYNKNILTLAEAAKVAKMPLVIVGKQAAEENFDRKHVENKPFARFLEKYGRDKDIKRLGFVEDNDLIKIYNLATVYCQPSFYEGFGLPLLEAFATGTPIVASKNNCHVEIGGDAVLLADPKSPQDMAEKITQVLKDEKLRKDLITKGETRAKKFDWGKTAKDTYDVYKSVIGSR